MENWTNLLKVVIHHGPTADQTYRIIVYRNSSLTLDESKYEYVMANLPEKWANDVEKLVRFDVRLEKNTGLIKYYVEVEKIAYDFRLRENRKFPIVKTPTDEECEELYQKFIDIYNKFSIDQYDNLYSSILENLKEKSIIAIKIIDMRDHLLRESDVYMLPDFPISEEDKEKMIEYRQQLRDLTEQEYWPDEIEKIEMPVSPVNQDTQVQIMSDYLFDTGVMDTRLKTLGKSIIESNSAEGVKGYISTVMKLNVLSSLYNLQIPMFVEQNDGSFEEVIKSARESLEVIIDPITLENFKANEDDESLSKYEESINELNAKIEMINETIASYDLGFTIDDIIKSMIEDKKINAEAEELVDNLLDEDLDPENTSL